ncbi:hypothetical protein [Rickettsiales endosymbiont of Trichoplax sp. H2]|uniref:WD_0702 family putative metalloprotease n=1 Tax=Rickettsiales endosymbiont of Trichoplax sp. H2 TaxID=2021221 RepID=UPI0012B29A38|nr:hypothetical protein [Rickettsiales endosymbiont of Trichoplax sp. H2]MSO13754.1 hypothetical protein [Rickettsiales endosymbiont of Trichoplax sp. H2]
MAEVSVDIITLINYHTMADNEIIKNRFIEHIKHLYQYSIFKNILDLVATKVSQNSLKFNIKEKSNFDLDEGNCKTIYEPLLDSYLNNFRQDRRYVITIKKIAYNVIIHEIAHMVEKELNLDLKYFIKALHDDFENINSNLIIVKNSIDEILIKQVSKYNVEQQNSELFARFFQLFAESREISGFQSQYKYSIQDISGVLSNSTRWIEFTLSKLISARLDINIVNSSKKFLKDMKNINHKWAKQKVQKLHNSNKNKLSKWTKAVKSIKDV